MVATLSSNLGKVLSCAIGNRRIVGNLCAVTGIYSEGITAFGHTRGFSMITVAEPAAYEVIAEAVGDTLVYESGLDYIDSNLDKDLSSSALCEEFAISRSNLYKLLSPYLIGGIADHILNRRIDRAKHLLKHTKDRRTIDLIATKGYRVGNIDATICAERPKLKAHIPLMQQTLADVMGIDEEDVTIKATTTEKLGFTGREEGISAYATVLIEKV